MLFFIAQIFGLGAMFSLFLVNQQKDRRSLITFKLITDLCWSVHYLCLSAWGGLIPNFVGVFRELIFMKRSSERWASSPVWPGVFICMNWILGFQTFALPVNILPIAGSTLVTISLWLKKADIIKLLLVGASSLFLIYDVFVNSWMGIACELTAISSAVIYFVKIRRERNGG